MKKNQNYVLFQRKILLRMKLTFFLLMLIAVQISASVSMHGQVTLNVQNESIRDVLREIENQSPYRFFYNEAFADLNKRVNINVDDTDINSTMDELLLMSDMAYKVLDNNLVVIAPRKELQQQEVTGRVTDADTGEGLPGASIVVEGTTIGTVTNVNGEYSLSNVPSDATLIFSFVGYRAQVLEIEGRIEINIAMEQFISELEEVVAVGYGVQRRVNLSGAVSVATAERLENRPLSDVGRALQGVIPNLNVTTLDSDPTRPATLNVRGFESITGGSPLILIDGIPGDLHSLNPNDIESVSVLKDASASAIYGARAAFGVILINTKEPADQFRVTFSTEQGYNMPIDWTDPVTDPVLFGETWNRATMRTDGTPRYEAALLESFRRYKENPIEENRWSVIGGILRHNAHFDYRGALVRDFVPQNRTNLVIDGSVEDRVSYYLSLGLHNQPGWLKLGDNFQFQRYNILQKANVRITDWLTLEGRVSYALEQNDQPVIYNWDMDITSISEFRPHLNPIFPDLPYYLEPGDRDKFAQYIGMSDGAYAYFKNGGRDKFNNHNLMLTERLTITPFEGLEINQDFTYRLNRRVDDYARTKVDLVYFNLNRYPDMIYHQYSEDDHITNRLRESSAFIFNTYANYTTGFNNHQFTGILGFNQEWYNNMSFTATGRSLITTGVRDINATMGDQTAGGGRSDLALRGAFMRLFYSYDEKYILEINGRYDGTSRFPAEDRFDFFPSFSAAWRISEESFMAGAEWLDNLKFRGSYGELGNQSVGAYYPYYATMSAGISRRYIPFGDHVSFVAPGGLISDQLTWETAATTNLGIDFNAFRGRFGLYLDFYRRDTRDMLMRMTYPDFLGTSAPQVNAADLRTSGWEFEMFWRDAIGGDWNYRLNLNLSDNRTEITKYDNPSGDLGDYYVGKQIGEIWGFRTEGIFQTEEEVANHADQSQLGGAWAPGDMKYADLNGDGRITYGDNTIYDPGDREIIGNDSPRYSFGINPGVSYRNLSIDLFFQGWFRDYLPPNASWQQFYPFKTRFIEHYYLTDTWSEDNRDAYFYAPYNAAAVDKNTLAQSRWVQNASYIRLKSLIISYNIPQNLTSRLRLSNAQVTFSGSNLWEYSPIRKPLDPEFITTRRDLQYYYFRNVSMGLRVTF